MKSFWISLALLAMLVVGTTLNHRYINRVGDEMTAQIDALPDIDAPDCIAKATALLSYWEERVDLVGLTVSFPIVDRVSEQATALIAAAECDDLHGYRYALALLTDAVEDMRRLERFSIENLF